MDMRELFGEVISSYTRAEGIADGFLVDVSETAREAGITFPVAMTRTAWEAAVAMTPAAERACNDIAGRLWDVLSILRWQAKRCSGSAMTLKVKVITKSIRAQWVYLKALCGPGDNAAPVITIMLPEED